MTGGRIVTFVLVLAVVVVSTSMDESSAQDNVITVGAVQALHGMMTPIFAEFDAGLRDCFDLANSEGGVNGKKIKYVVESCKYGGSNPKEANRLFAMLIADHQPLAMWGQSTAQSMALANDIREKYKVLYTSPSQSAEVAQAEAFPSMFVTGPTFGQQMAMLLKYVAKSSRGARVAFFHADDTFGRDPIPFGRIMCRRLRLKLVAEVTAKHGEKDVSAQVSQLKESNPDYIIFHGFLGRSPMPEAVAAIRTQGMSSQLMGTFHSTNKMTIQNLGDFAEGYLGVSPYAFWWMEKVPMIKKLREYSARKHPEVTHRTPRYLHAFVAGLIMVEVFKRADRAGELKYDGVCKALASIKDFDTGGLAPPLTNIGNKFPVAQIWRANAQEKIFQPASMPPGLGKWLKFGY